MNQLIYLAIPYSTNKTLGFRVANRISAQYFRCGYAVFSPISHCHTIAEMFDLPTDFEFWENYNQLMISKCDALHVIKLTGFETSIGVQAAIKIAQELGLPILYLDPNKGPIPCEEIKNKTKKHLEILALYYGV